MTASTSKATRGGRRPAERGGGFSRQPTRHKIPIGDATALTLIANYPEMPVDEFEDLVRTIRTPRAKRKAHEIRRYSIQLNEDPDAKVGDSDSALLAKSAMAGAGR